MSIAVSLAWPRACWPSVGSGSGASERAIFVHAVCPTFSVARPLVGLFTPAKELAFVQCASGRREKLTTLNGNSNF